MRRAALVLLAVAMALPLAGLAAAQLFLSEDALRARLEAAVEKATGRALTVAGPVRLAWSLTPTIEASDLSLANPPGFSRPALAHVDRVAARIGLLALLSRRVEVTGLTIAGPDIRLERDAQGRPNWTLSRAAPAEPAAAPPAGEGRKMVVAITEIAVTGATLAYRGAQLVELAAPRLSYDPESGRLAGDLAFRGVALRVSGTAGQGALDLHLEGAGLDLALSGAASGYAVSAAAADLSALSPLANAPLPALRDVRFAAKAIPAAGSLALDGLTLTSAQGDLAGHLVLTGAPRPALRGALRATRLDLDALVPAPAPPAPSPVPTAASPGPSAPGPLIPDVAIPFAALLSADADLQLDAATLVWRGRTATGVALHATLLDGRLLLEPARITFGDKPLSARIEAVAGNQTLALKVEGPGLPAGPVAALFGGPAASGAIDLSADLHATGATWRAMAGSLQGRAGLAMADGEIDNAWLLDKLQAAFRAANLPVTAGGDSKIRCAAFRADADAGKVQVQALTLDTSKLQLEGAGGVDLGAETIDLHLRPTLRLGATLSVPVHVGGTLRAPKVALDPGALAPGRIGLSIGGAAPPDTCGPALALARGGPPPPPESVANRPLKPADFLRGLLR